MASLTNRPRGASESWSDPAAEPFGGISDPALFLDFDGTLVDIAPTPEAVVAPPGLVDLLRRLEAVTGGALAVLTGRPLAFVDGKLAPLRVFGAGQHGAELRSAAGETVVAPRSTLDPVRTRLAALAADWPEGARIEDKGLALAVHFRACPEAGARIDAAVADAAAAIGERFHVRRSKMVVEVTLAGTSKGVALARLMDMAPFRGRTPVVFGDDTTDDDAFDAARALGGLSYQVGARAGHRADRELAAPSDVHHLLAGVVPALSLDGRRPA